MAYLDVADDTLRQQPHNSIRLVLVPEQNLICKEDP